MSDATPPADLATLQHILDTMLAPWVQQLNLRPMAVDGDTLVLALPIAPPHVHGGNVMCGQTMMAAADTGMVMAVSRVLGGFKPMTTVQLQTSFLRAVAGSQAETVGEARVLARVLKRGRNIVFCEIEILDPAGRLAAHATGTYALL